MKSAVLLVLCTAWLSAVFLATPSRPPRAALARGRPRASSAPPAPDGGGALFESAGWAAVSQLNRCPSRRRRRVRRAARGAGDVLRRRRRGPRASGRARRAGASSSTSSLRHDACARSASGRARPCRAPSSRRRRAAGRGAGRAGRAALWLPADHEAGRAERHDARAAALMSRADASARSTARARSTRARRARARCGGRALARDLGALALARD